MEVKWEDQNIEHLTVVSREFCQLLKSTQPKEETATAKRTYDEGPRRTNSQPFQPRPKGCFACNGEHIARDC